MHDMKNRSSGKPTWLEAMITWMNMALVIQKTPSGMGGFFISLLPNHATLISKIVGSNAPTELCQSPIPRHSQQLQSERECPTKTKWKKNAQVESWTLENVGEAYKCLYLLYMLICGICLYLLYMYTHYFLKQLWLLFRFRNVEKNW